MPLIKPNQAVRVPHDAMTLDLCDLQEQADQIVAAARREADAIRAEAEAEAKRRIDAAAGEGHRQGMERGLAEGRATGAAEGRAEAVETYGEQLETLSKAWTETLERWEERFESMLLAAREDVLVFAFAMARKIVMRTPTVDTSVVQDQLVEALSLLCRPSAVTVAVHPDDRALADEVLPAILERVARGDHAKLQEDESITRGGCIVRTGEGVIDARLETQIERIAETLLPAASPPSAESDSGVRDGSAR